MPKRKLFKYAQLLAFNNVFQVAGKCVEDDFFLKGRWHKEYFKNNKPIIIELGCGKGEYTLALSEMFPLCNFIGIDYKGDRLYTACKTALEKNLRNAVFIRTQIQFIEKFFSPGEVDEIWITFPDPQLQKPKHPKRLTSTEFLNRYKNILKPHGLIHLKTDNTVFFDETIEVLQENNQVVEYMTRDISSELNVDPVLHVKTYYEAKFSALGAKIKYLRFRLSLGRPFENYSI